MTNVGEYFLAVDQIRSQIQSEVVHITSRYTGNSNSVAGRVCFATRDLAARCIASGTHQLSSPEEAEAHDREMTAHVDGQKKEKTIQQMIAEAVAASVQQQNSFKQPVRPAKEQ